MFNLSVKSFSDFVNESKSNESENKTESMRNYKAYLAGKEPLRHAIFTHREGDKLYDFIKGNIVNKFSVYPEGYWDKYRENIQNK